MLAWFLSEKHKSSSSRDFTFLCVADIRRNNSHEVIVRSYCDETLPNAREWTLHIYILMLPLVYTFLKARSIHTVRF